MLIEFKLFKNCYHYQLKKDFRSKEFIFEYVKSNCTAL